MCIFLEVSKMIQKRLNITNKGLYMCVSARERTNERTVVAVNTWLCIPNNQPTNKQNICRWISDSSIKVQAFSLIRSFAVPVPIAVLSVYLTQIIIPFYNLFNIQFHARYVCVCVRLFILKIIIFYAFHWIVYDTDVRRVLLHFLFMF